MEKGSIMENIRRGLKQRHRPGVKDDFIEAFYTLFEEYRDVYRMREWPRLNECERIYQGDHWHDVAMNPEDPREPRPTTPVVFSTIENIRADMTDEYPEAVIKPEDAGSELVAKILTEVIAQTLEAGDYDREYDSITHDLLVGGWAAQESGWDQSMNNGMGGGYLRHVSNKNIMVDPYCSDLQNGRAVFKFDRLPKDWFRQHYPEAFPKMEDDTALFDQYHGDFESTTRPTGTDHLFLIEAWFRVFDPKTNRYAVHMVQAAGGCILANSFEIKPDGYYAHGMYPFVITPLFEMKGTPLGLGIVDMFKSAQQYSDKIDQIILKNALTAGHNRIFYQEGLVDAEDLKDYSKEVVQVQGPPQAVMAWQQDRPLPSHILAYMQQKLQTIKEESGSNDFSRGNVSAGVTAASAITALQEMSSKRSRMEARRIHYGFKQAIRQLIEVIREFDRFPRQVIVTIGGEPTPVIVSHEMYRQMDGGALLPIEFRVSIKAVRETKFTKLSNNQLILEFCSMFQGQMDPVILMEAMDFEGQEIVLEKMRVAQAQGIAALQQQLAEAGAAAEEAQTENAQLKQALAAAQTAITGRVPEALPTDIQNAGNGVF